MSLDFHWERVWGCLHHEVKDERGIIRRGMEKGVKCSWPGRCEMMLRV